MKKNGGGKPPPDEKKSREESKFEKEANTRIFWGAFLELERVGKIN